MMIQNNGEFFRSEWSWFTVLVPSLIEVNVRWVVCHGFVEVGILGGSQRCTRRARVHTGRVCRNLSCGFQPVGRRALRDNVRAPYPPVSTRDSPYRKQPKLISPRSHL